MIPAVFNGMISLLLAKFCLNDVPHAIGVTQKAELMPAYNVKPGIMLKPLLPGVLMRQKSMLMF